VKKLELAVSALLKEILDPPFVWGNGVARANELLLS